MTLEHPELTPEVLARLNETLAKFEREAKPQDGMIIEVARMMSVAWRAGQAGKHPEIAVMTDLCRQVVQAAMMLGACNMCEFYLRNLHDKSDKAPPDLFTPGGQEVYWGMAHNVHADHYNTLLKSLPNLVDHAYRDGPGPLPPFPWETPNETKEGTTAGEPGLAGCNRGQAGADPGQVPQD